jgi:hypothetical protein
MLCVNLNSRDTRTRGKGLRSDKCLILQKDEASGKDTVSNITNSLSKQRTFLSQGQRCDCNECITEETQCSHEIKFWGGFRPSLFQPCHFRQLKVTTSLNGWTPTTTSTINSILGIIMEDTGNHSDDDNDGLVSFLESGCVDDVLNDDTDLVISEMSHQFQPFDLSPSHVPPISNASLRDIFGHIVSFYDKSSSDTKYLIGGLAIKMKEIVCEGIKLTKSINIDVKQSSMTYINNLMKDVVQRYQQAFAHKADVFSNTIDPNTSVNRPLTCFMWYYPQATLQEALGTCSLVTTLLQNKLWATNHTIIATSNF